jgi:micrococcal nuclease
VAEVFLMTEPEQSVQQEMLTSGMIYIYPQYIEGCPNAVGFKMAEAIGKESKVGVWARLISALGIIGRLSGNDEILRV